MKPVLALVGRPNVGKSTLFNRLTKTRDAIVADYAGLTRIRHYGKGKQGKHEYIVIDTGGFEPTAEDGIYKEMAKQTRQAVAEADVVIFVVDARGGLSAQDHDIANYLRRLGKPCVLVANKAKGMTDHPAGRVLRTGPGRGVPGVGRARAGHTLAGRAGAGAAAPARRGRRRGGRDTRENILYESCGNFYKPGKLAVQVISLAADEQLGNPVQMDIYAPEGPFRYPVIIFQHGFTGSIKGYETIFNHIASHGFVIVAPQMYPPGGGMGGAYPTPEEEAALGVQIISGCRRT